MLPKKTYVSTCGVSHEGALLAGDNRFHQAARFDMASSGDTPDAKPVAERIVTATTLRNLAIPLSYYFPCTYGKGINAKYYSTTVKTDRIVGKKYLKAGLRLLEDAESKLATLRKLLAESEESGLVDYSYDELVSELDH